MKTLKKIHLKSVSEFLSDRDMKLVVGGGDNGVTVYGGDGTYEDPFQLGELTVTACPTHAFGCCKCPGPPSSPMSAADLAGIAITHYLYH